MGQTATEVQHIGCAVTKVYFARGGKRHGLRHIGHRTIEAHIKTTAVGHAVSVYVACKRDAA